MNIRVRRLAPHHHSGVLRPHHHTSYAGLMFVLLLTGVVLAGYSNGVGAAVRAAEVAKAPTLNPLLPNANGNVATVSGTCDASTYVVVIRNGVDAGASDCGENGAFSAPVSLFLGTNTIAARARTLSGVQGPASGNITTEYNDAAAVIGQQLFLQSSGLVAAGQTGRLTRRAEITGGVSPYAIAWDWGDGSKDVNSQALGGIITAEHSYAQARNYTVTLRVTDAVGGTAVLQLIATTSAASAVAGSSTPGMRAAAAWPLYLAAVLLVASFWLGDLRENAKLRRRRLQSGF